MCYIILTKQFNIIFLVDFYMEIITQEKNFVKRLSNKKEVPHMGKIKKLTQKDKVLNHLKKNGSITAIEAMNKYYIVDLAGCIRDLIKLGVKIEKRWEKNPRTRWIRYYLVEQKTKDANSEKVAA